MIKINYLDYDFRHIIWMWKDLHPDYTTDFKFIDIVNQFETTKNIQIEIDGSVFTFKDLDNENKIIKYTDYMVYGLIDSGYDREWDSLFLKTLYNKTKCFKPIELYW